MQADREVVLTLKTELDVQDVIALEEESVVKKQNRVLDDLDDSVQRHP